MSSSSEAVVAPPIPGARVVRGDSAAAAAGLATPELRAGSWTRLGGQSVLGDSVTEQTLATLAESTRAAARSQGYAIGWAQGRREATESARLVAEETDQARAIEDARREAEHRTAIAALEAATGELQRTLAAVCEQVAAQATELALELTRELVGHELSLGGAAGEHVVRRALGHLPDHAVARLRLHPEVAATVTDAGPLVTVVADSSLGLGDALVEADDHVVDLRISAALDRLREVLA